MTDQSKYHVPARQTFSIGTPTPNHCVHFHNSDGKTVGALNFNGAELVFTGDADESAKIFIDCAAQWFSERLKQERKAALEEAAKEVDHIMFFNGRTWGDKIRKLAK